MNRRKLIPLLCAVTAFLSWYFLPGTFLDRALFTATAHISHKSPFLITGKGVASNPYTVRKFQGSSEASTSRAPTIISIGDDPDRVFQSSPPSPVDVAIILRNLRRLGENSPAIATPLAWPSPDTISLTALDQQLDSLPSVVTAAPLSRGPDPTIIPPAFRRASIPLEHVHGDTTLLPTVNRLAIPDVILGNKTSLAGFSIIESEKPTGLPQLLCKWDDRLILSFHLVATLEHFKVPPSGIEVRLGEYLSLGRNGPFIPIDEFGRLSFSPEPLESKTIIPASQLVDAPDDFFPETDTQPIILRNDLTVADRGTRIFSESLVPVIATLTNTSEDSKATSYPALPWPLELAYLSLILFLLFPPVFPRILKLKDFRIPAIIGLITVLHLLFFLIGNITIPTIPALITVGSAAILLLIQRNKSTSGSPSEIVGNSSSTVANATPGNARPSETQLSPTKIMEPEPSSKPLTQNKTAIVIEPVQPKSTQPKPAAKKTARKSSAKKAPRTATRQSRISQKAAKNNPYKKKSKKGPKS
ncbi:hypothetical protein [Luteolibacter sp. AS25]|uniref:hypothetical protein n=1 Tax=Luteolibacter sp. AS25 TaxID=3135776 RepID=UPI00398AAA6B